MSNMKPTHRAYIVTEPKDKTRKAIFESIPILSCFISCSRCASRPGRRLRPTRKTAHTLEPGELRCV